VLISESYRQLNKLLHESRPDYGTSGQRYAGIVEQLVEKYGTHEVLDYGCGKRTMQAALTFAITNYDPCIPGLDSVPEPHDIVTCTDVLEHIEPECLAEVLADIRRCTKRVALLLVATRPAKKTLADGRNAHLIQEPYDWWRDKFAAAGFTVLQVQEHKGEFLVICE
jgi:hypothetical protein